MTDLALPPCGPDGPDAAALIESVRAWFTSPALAALVEHFGGAVPDGPLDTVLDRVAEFSRVWDFRGGVRERFDTDRINYLPAVDEMLRGHIRTLNLGGHPPAHDEYDHVIVLGGGIRISMGRSGYAARLVAGGLRTRTVAGLGSLRYRDDREHREGLRLGLPPVETEADMMSVGLRHFMELPEPTTHTDGDGWWHRVWAGTPTVHVLAAASTRPPLRANTADTLIGWAHHVHTPGPGERVLLITNDPYVRYQQCDAVRLLGMRFGCGIETVGFDAEARREWYRPLSTTELLQEVRSSILAMRNLHHAVVAAALGG
ncbi:hypothetical protein Val02_06820 [Virgisporangium aliadipatigenens]|uniref:Uncharacterized protein n=1 Tax=Virgisporangium aliadipatigenens TaxID=741659 RepID=A0A8J4DNG6_9ACTN|nr:hypothetical protein [Virgisporangium aliadipatigenens]GIJ43796.1 hypothetical protein Val02_06820 [Virgisporangium aliadipatigenens]